MYRAVTWSALDRGLDLDDTEAVAERARELRAGGQHRPGAARRSPRTVPTSPTRSGSRGSARASARSPPTSDVRSELVRRQREIIDDSPADRRDRGRGPRHRHRGRAGGRAEGAAHRRPGRPDGAPQCRADRRPVRRRAVRDQIVRRDADDATVAQFLVASDGAVDIDSTSMTLEEVDRHDLPAGEQVRGRSADQESEADRSSTHGPAADRRHSAGCRSGSADMLRRPARLYFSRRYDITIHDDHLLPHSGPVLLAAEPPGAAGRAAAGGVSRRGWCTRSASVEMFGGSMSRALLAFGQIPVDRTAYRPARGPDRVRGLAGRPRAEHLPRRDPRCGRLRPDQDRCGLPGHGDRRARRTAGGSGDADGRYRDRRPAAEGQPDRRGVWRARPGATAYRFPGGRPTYARLPTRSRETLRAHVQKAVVATGNPLPGEPATRGLQ